MKVMVTKTRDNRTAGKVEHFNVMGKHADIIYIVNDPVLNFKGKVPYGSICGENRICFYNVFHNYWILSYVTGSMGGDVFLSC